MGETTADPERVARYLAGLLPPAQNREFEALLSRRPELVRELEASARFREGLATLRERGELEALVQGRLRRPRWVPVGIAASMAALAIGAAFWLGRMPTATPLLGGSLAALQGKSGAAVSLSSTYRLVTSRDAMNPALQVDLPGARAALEFRVLAEDRPERATYRVTLDSIAADGTLAVVGAADSLQTDSEGFVRVFADSARLAPGAYELTLTSGPQPAAAATVRFRLLVRPPDRR